MTTETPELKPCPFCGQPAHMAQGLFDCAVWCPNCRVTLDRHNEEQAIAAWNTRVQPAPQEIAHAAD